MFVLYIKDQILNEKFGSKARDIHLNIYMK